MMVSADIPDVQPWSPLTSLPLPWGARSDNSVRELGARRGLKSPPSRDQYPWTESSRGSRCEAALARAPGPRHIRLVVVLQAQVRDQFLALQVAQRVLQFHQLDEQVMLGVKARDRHWRFEVEAEPLLYANSLQIGAALGEIEEQDQVQDDGRGKDRIAAQEVDFDLHGVPQPSEDV